MRVVAEWKRGHCQEVCIAAGESDRDRILCLRDVDPILSQLVDAVDMAMPSAGDAIDVVQHLEVTGIADPASGKIRNTGRRHLAAQRHGPEDASHQRSIHSPSIDARMPGLLREAQPTTRGPRHCTTTREKEKGPGF